MQDTLDSETHVHAITHRAGDGPVVSLLVECQIHTICDRLIVCVNDTSHRKRKDK